jgi:hypothetical protein
MRRVAEDLDIKFDVPEAVFAFDSGRTRMTDSPLPAIYVVTVKNRSMNSMQISNWFLPFEWDSKIAWPVFSEHMEERDVRNIYGNVLGKERWGYFKTGDRWRLIKFAGKEEVGYPPMPLKEAQLFDQVISSACFSAAPRP